MLHGSHGVLDSGLPYKRASETAHGGLFGLHGDKTIEIGGKFRFKQSDGDLDSAAAAVAGWWVTAVLCVAGLEGWDGDGALEPFTLTWRALYE